MSARRSTAFHDTAVFSPYTLAGLELRDRLVMVPMTRNRAVERRCAHRCMVTYYAQCAGAGLIMAEGTQPSAAGQGYPNTPGMHTRSRPLGGGG